MRKINLLLALFLLISVSVVAYGEDNPENPILKFSKPIKEGKVSLPFFVSEVKKDSIFYNSFQSKLKRNISIIKFSKSDSSIILTFTLSRYKREFSDVSADSLVIMINEPINDAFLKRLTKTFNKSEEKDQVSDRVKFDSLGNYILNVHPDSLANYFTSNPKVKERTLYGITPFYIRFWWAWILLATLLTALFSWILMKKYYKTDIEKLFLDHINEHLGKKEFEKYRSINEIIEKLRHSESRIPGSAHELEVKKYERQIKESEEGLSQWLDIVDKKKPQEVKAFLLANGFYDNQVNPNSSNLQVAQTQVEKIYFSDVNRGKNDIGVFQEDNGSKSLKNDTLYKLEILKQSPQKANFYLIADEPSMLSPRSFKLDPFCTVLNDGSPTKKIITKDYGLAELEGDKWVVKEKAKVRYV
jgi:hypothetical protein